MMGQAAELDEVVSPGACWRKAGTVLAVSLLVLLIVYRETFSSIVAIWWRSDTFAHGFLVVPIVIYLIWRKRPVLARLVPRPSPWAFVLLLCLSLAWLVGHAANVLLLQQIAVVAMIPVMLLMALGWPVVAKIAFPLAYLFFAVPMGNFLVPTLQDFTAAFAVKALQLSGIPVYWEGRFFHIPGGTFEVAAACSGVRYLIASVALGVLYAYLNYRTLSRRLAFIALSVVVPIIANGLRAYGIVMLAHLSGYRLAVGVDHLVYGWLFFGLVMLFLFWVGSLFHEPSSPEANEGEGESPDSLSPPSTWGWVSHLALAAGMLAMLAGPMSASWLDEASAGRKVVVPSLPQGMGGWEGPFADAPSWGASFQGATEQVLAEYRKDGKRVRLFVAHYLAQDQGAELINALNVFYDRKSWRRTGGGEVDIRLSDGREEALQETAISAGEDKRLLWHWYMVDGRMTINPVAVKLLEVRGRLTGAPPRSAAIVLAADYEIEETEARTLLRDFIDAMLPGIQAMVNGVR